MIFDDHNFYYFNDYILVFSVYSQSFDAVRITNYLG